jgi:hypothetical protein
VSSQIKVWRREATKLPVKKSRIARLLSSFDMLRLDNDTHIRLTYKPVRSQQEVSDHFDEVGKLIKRAADRHQLNR